MMLLADGTACTEALRNVMHFAVQKAHVLYRDEFGHHDLPLRANALLQRDQRCAYQGAPYLVLQGKPLTLYQRISKGTCRYPQKFE
jgi:hypothetical protein